MKTTISKISAKLTLQGLQRQLFQKSTDFNVQGVCGKLLMSSIGKPLGTLLFRKHKKTTVGLEISKNRDFLKIYFFGFLTKTFERTVGSLWL
jgi:hypothetical protein